MKHPSFKDEREWRAVSEASSMYGDDWHYRAKERSLAAYKILKLPSVFSKEAEAEGKDTTPHFHFTLGPKVNRGPTGGILQALNRRISGKAYGVTLSDVPYTD